MNYFNFDFINQKIQVNLLILGVIQIYLLLSISFLVFLSSKVTHNLHSLCSYCTYFLAFQSLKHQKHIISTPLSIYRRKKKVSIITMWNGTIISGRTLPNI